MATTKKKLLSAKRLALYRQRAKRSGLRRVEVAVPVADVAIIRNVAHAFREGGTEAERLRRQVEATKNPQIAKTSAELIAILRAGIGEGFELELPPRLYEEPRDTGF